MSAEEHPPIWWHRSRARRAWLAAGVVVVLLGMGAAGISGFRRVRAQTNGGMLQINGSVTVMLCNESQQAAGPAQAGLVCVTHPAAGWTIDVVNPYQIQNNNTGQPIGDVASFENPASGVIPSSVNSCGSATIDQQGDFSVDVSGDSPCAGPGGPGDGPQGDNQYGLVLIDRSGLSAFLIDVICTQVFSNDPTTWGKDYRADGLREDLYAINGGATPASTPLMGGVAVTATPANAPLQGGASVTATPNATPVAATISATAEPSAAPIVATVSATAGPSAAPIAATVSATAAASAAPSPSPAPSSAPSPPPSATPSPSPSPHAQIWSVQFAATPVVRDCSTAPAGDGFANLSASQRCPPGAIVQTVNQFPPQSMPDPFAASCPQTMADWLDCSAPLNGTPEKNWPVLVTRGTHLGITEARFRVPAGVQLTNATVEATASATACGGSTSLHFPAAGATLSADGSELIVNDLASTETLPNCVAFLNQATITWQVDADQGTFPAGQSSHDIYLMYKDPFAPIGSSAPVACPSDPAVLPNGPGAFCPYLTLVDLTVAGAGGLSTFDDPAVAGGIWSQFSGRNVHRRDLDPVSGAVTIGDQLDFYAPWSLEDFLGGASFSDTLNQNCPPNTMELLMSETVGRCGSWATFFATGLGLQGLPAAAVGVDDEAGWNASAYFPEGAQYMLIGMQQWRFTPPGTSRYPDFRFEDDTQGTDGALSWVSPPEFQYTPGTANVAQGNNAPPGMFGIGDHAVVNEPVNSCPFPGNSGGTPGPCCPGGTPPLPTDDCKETRIYDPSYGTGPFENVGAWAMQSLAGSATFSPADESGPADCGTREVLGLCSFYGHQGLLNATPGP